MTSRARIVWAAVAGALAALPAAEAKEEGPCFAPVAAISSLDAAAKEAARAVARERRAPRFSGNLFADPAPAEVVPAGRRRFVPALGELVLLEVGPWAFDRYVARYDFAFISTRTIKDNFRTGFQYDRDDFVENQSSHPFHGSLFFNAGRSNGFGFWESGVFAMTGSLLWECCMENTAPSINDFVNTTLGGMTRGEIAHRLSAMLLDNTATGSGRVLREIGAAVLNPVGSFNRLLRGELGREFANPDDRFPSLVVLAADVGYRHIGGGAAHPNQGIVTLSLLYGDPFHGDITRPFDSFWLGVDLTHPGGVLFSRIEERGVLKGWELTDSSDAVRHIVGFSQEYEYLNNAAQVFGAEILSGGVLSRYTFGPKVMATTDVTLLAIPLAGIQTIDFESPETGRNYDYAPGGGARAEGRAYVRGREIAGAGYGVVWARTANGVSDTNTLQFFRAVARLPLVSGLSAGAGYSWYSRKTTYSRFFEARKTQSEWRVFLNGIFPFPFR